MLLVDDYDRLKNSNPVAICRPFPGSGGQGAVLHIPTPTPAKNRVKISSPKPWAKDVAVQTYNDVVRMCPDGTRNDFRCFLISRWLDQSWVTSTKSLIRARTSLEPKATTQEHCLDFHQAYRKAYTSRDMHCTSTALALQCSIASMLAK